MPQEQYQWLVIVGALAAWLFGWGTGSNDVANAFGTSVGSGALTLKQAIVIAAIFEFVGAMVLGRVSTSVIAGGIADGTVFTKATDCNGPMAYAYGMMWTLILGGLWQGFASYSGLNVSATHSIIAGIIGFALQFRKNGVIWLKELPPSTSTSGLPYGGIVPIVITWFFAPIATGFCSSVLFATQRYFILRSPDSFNRAFYVLPLLVFFTFWINIYFVFTKGAKKTFTEQNGGGDDWSDDKAAWVAACVAAGLCIVSALCLPFVRQWVMKWDHKEQETKALRQARRMKILEERGLPGIGSQDVEDSGHALPAGWVQTQDPAGRIYYCNPSTGESTWERPAFNPVVDQPTVALPAADGFEASAQNTDATKNVQIAAADVDRSKLTPAELAKLKSMDKGLDIPPDIMVDPIGNIKAQWRNLLDFDYGMDFFDDLDDKVEDMHNRAEKFDPLTEKVYGFLQIFSATCVMFAHGAGEVGYMAGPLATIYEVYMTNKLPSKVSAPIWTVIISAFSLVFGLATYGRNVVKAVGKDLAKITPSRGFCAEICTAIVIMVAAQYGLPTSSSQAITGGIVGIGIVEGIGGVNWFFFLETFSSWIMTMVVMGLGTALMFAQGHNAP